MKKLVLAAALMVATAAFAQSGQTVSDPSQSTGPHGITQQGTDPDGQAVAPPGTNQPVTAPPGARVDPRRQSERRVRAAPGHGGISGLLQDRHRRLRADL